MTQVSYMALTARGAVIKTFDTLAAAKKWAFANAETYPGMEVIEEVITTTRRRAYRPAIRLVEMAS